MRCLSAIRRVTLYLTHRYVGAPPQGDYHDPTNQGCGFNEAADYVDLGTNAAIGIRHVRHQAPSDAVIASECKSLSPWLPRSQDTAFGEVGCTGTIMSLHERVEATRGIAPQARRFVSLEM